MGRRTINQFEQNLNTDDPNEQGVARNQNILLSNQNQLKNQNLKNKIPRTGALRSFFKNENYNFDSQIFLNKSTDGSLYSQNKSQDNSIIFKQNEKIEDFKLAESFQEQIIQNQSQNNYEKSIHTRTHKDLLNEMSYSDKQKVIFENADRIELLADQNSQAFHNDITRQFTTYEPITQKLIGDVGKQQLFELDPVRYQVCSQSLIPKQIRKSIADQRQILFEDYEYLTPVGRQNIIKSSGHLVDDYYYAYVDCNLYLWKSNMETFRGVNQNINERTIFDQLSKGDRDNFIRNIDANYKHKELKNPIQCILFIEDHSQQFQPGLIVVTNQEISLFSFTKIENDLSFRQERQKGLSRDKFDLRAVIESDYSPIGINIGEEITCLKQCNKTGRIYYASHNNNYYKTYIHELQLYNNSKLEKLALSVERVGQSFSRFTNPGTSYFKKIIGNRKRLQSVNIQEHRDLTVSTIKKLIPDAINFYLERKTVEQIQIDQQRNVLYVLAKQVKDEERSGVLSEKQIHNSLLSSFSSGFSQQKLITTSSLIEIYDLGALGEDCTRICRISQEAIFDKLQPKLGIFMRKNENKEVYLEEMRKFDILSISPIGQSESNEVQLLITLKNSLRVYIQFGQKSVSKLETKSDVEVERLNLQFDLRRDFKLTPIWDIYALRYLPNSHQAIDSYAEFPYPFQQHIVNRKQGQHDQNNQIEYCNQTSSLIYSENQLKDKEDPESNFLKLCLISKNQGAFCQLKELQQLAIQDLIPGQPSQGHQLLECFSLLQIEKLNINDNDQHLQIDIADDQYYYKLDEIQKLKEDEYIIDLKSSSQLGFMQGDSTSQIPLEIQQMLGGNHSLKNEAAFGLNNRLWYNSISQMEKQVYEDTVGENQIKILTNLREINIVELRPVDQLGQILNQIAQMQVKDFTIATFQEFCDKFGIEEVCCMLLQIIISNRNSKYLQSQKVKQALNKSAIISNRQRSEGQFINPNQSLIQRKNADASLNQKILKNRVSVSSYSHRPGQFLSSQKKISQTGQFSKSPQSIRRGLGASHQSVEMSQNKKFQSNYQKQNSINLPYYLRQSDLPELYPFVYQNKEQQQNDQIMNQANKNDSIYKDIFSANNEINGNCNFVQLEQLKIKEWAHKLLQVYGDSINSQNEIKFIESCKNFQKQQVKQDLSSNSQLTYRFKAIYLLIQRILRPIWDTYLTSLKNSSCLEAQNSNFECLKPALNKLESLLGYLEQNQEEIIKSQTLEDHNFFNKQSQNVQNIKSDKIIFTHQFTLNIRERLDYSQRQIIRGLMVFIKRCIDSIQFFKAFSFADEVQDSKKMVQVLLLKLSKEKDGFYFLSELSNTKLKDLILQGGFSNQQTFIAAKNQQLDYASQIKEFFKNSILGQEEVEEYEKSKLVRKLYELTVNFSARKMAEKQLQKSDQTKDLWQYLEFLQNLNVTSQQISGFAEKIQKACPTFFSDSETVSLIGESLLAQAIIEKDKEQQLTLVNNALIQIKKMPQSIVILSTAETLCKLNCFIEIVEVCLVKIKYLKNTINSIDLILNQSSNLDISNFRQSANSAISKANFQNEIQNYEEQLLECYFTILNLFMAIDQQISEVQNSYNHSQNLNMLEKLQQIESTQKKNTLSQFFNFWQNKVEEKKLSIFENFLKQLLLCSKEPIEKSIQLREAIIHKVEDFGDSHLLKNLFNYIICQPSNIEQLPKVDLQSFEDVLNMIQEKQNPIKKECIDFLFKLMCKQDALFIKSSSDQQIDFRIKLCLLGLTKKICKNNQPLLKKEPDSFLNQKEKINYIQKTIDSINILLQSDNSINQDQIKLLRSESNVLQNIINHLQFQIKVTNNLKDKYKTIERKYLKKFQSSEDPSLSNHIIRLNEQIKDLKQAAKQCETMNYEEADLFLIIDQYQLRTLQFEILDKQYQKITQAIFYNENQLNDSQQEIISKFLDLFQKCIKEIKDLAGIQSCNLFKKEILDKEYMDCFLQLISFCHLPQLLRQAIRFLLNDQLNYFLAQVDNNEHHCQMILKQCIDTINQGSFGLNKATHFGILVQLFKLLADNQLIKPNFRADDMFLIINDLIPKDKFIENDKLKIEVYYTMVQKLIAIYLFVNRYFIVQSEQASLKLSLEGKYHKALVEDIKKFTAPQFQVNRGGERKSHCDLHIAEVTKTLLDDNILNIAESFSASVKELVNTIDISKKELVQELKQ